MHILNLILGLAMLFFGWRLFWLFVAAVGFLVAMEFSPDVVEFLGVEQKWLDVLIPIAVGAAGALIAIALQQLAMVLMGVAVGVILATHIAELMQLAGYEPVVQVLGGVLGLVVAVKVADWAIVSLSCLLGAARVVDELALEAEQSLLVFGVLVVAGGFVQAKHLRVHDKTKRIRRE